MRAFINFGWFILSHTHSSHSYFTENSYWYTETWAWGYLWGC